MMRPFIRFSNPFKPSGKTSPRFISLWAVLSLMKMHTKCIRAAGVHPKVARAMAIRMACLPIVSEKIKTVSVYCKIRKMCYNE